MYPPVELQQIDTLHSVILPLNITDLIHSFTNGSSGLGETLHNFWLLLPNYAVSLMMRLIPLSLFLSLISILIIIYCSVKLIIIRRKMKSDLNLPETEVTSGEGVSNSIFNEKWQKVIIHINSSNPSDWKLAILECDIMLAEILEKMGYLQPSISEKLKSIESSDFTNIENAWEAHKIRNQIAHEGSEFLINEREAKRVIGLYETVFREFEYI